MWNFLVFTRTRVLALLMVLSFSGSSPYLFLRVVVSPFDFSGMVKTEIRKVSLSTVDLLFLVTS